MRTRKDFLDDLEVATTTIEASNTIDIKNHLLFNILEILLDIRDLQVKIEERM